MTAVSLIEKKRDGQALSDAELKMLIDSFTRGDLPDYQMAAFLMAVYFRGMTTEETVTLTRLMRDSGTRLDLSDLFLPAVDKHSTGGVGDKVSLVLAPLVAACGVLNPMISGRSLGHTGGTLDKLEAIPGFSTQIDLPNFERILRKLNVCLIGQTPEICPADKKIYALRDATATVPSIPLICGSILSKKLAEDLDVLVLDVKCGNGAIFANQEEAEELASALVSTGARFGLRITALLTQMEQPLGRAIGTWLETREAIDMLNGHAEPDFYEVTLTLSAYMLWLSGITSTLDEARELAAAKLAGGEAWARFRQVVQEQGGDLGIVDAPETYPAAKHSHEIRAQQGGFVHAVHARTLGQVSMQLGAGRAKKEDSIDYTAGIVIEKKVSDKVAAGDLLATLYASQNPIPTTLIERVTNAFTIKAEEIAPLPSILGIIDERGKHAHPRM